ncbi:hypothetical protein [Niallia circulans]|nr:hypothetical protein [Niallia circulans]
MIKFEKIIIELLESEKAENKCSYCWKEATENYCENCDVKVDDWHELI